MCPPLRYAIRFDLVLWWRGRRRELRIHLDHVPVKAADAGNGIEQFREAGPLLFVGLDGSDFLGLRLRNGLGDRLGLSDGLSLGDGLDFLDGFNVIRCFLDGLGDRLFDDLFDGLGHRFRLVLDLVYAGFEPFLAFQRA